MSYNSFIDSFRGQPFQVNMESSPIIRLSPYELHVADPVFADALYPNLAKNVEKWSNDDASIFPKPRNFDPQRWLGPERNIRQNFLFNFGRGTRPYEGMNMAEAEIHVALATTFSKLGRQMELYDSEREWDVDVKDDFFVTDSSLDSRGVRVTLSSNKRGR